MNFKFTRYLNISHRAVATLITIDCWLIFSFDAHLWPLGPGVGVNVSPALAVTEWGGLTHIQMTARGNILLWSNILNITLIKQQQVVICWVFLRFCNVLMLPLKSWSSSNECYISSTHDCHTSYYRVWPDNSCVTECHHYTKYHYHHCHYHHHYPDIWDRYQLAASPALSLGADIKLIWECAEHSEHY